MESDIIVEGFLKANDFGVRYMHFIADGDSSIHAQIMERVPVWGKFVQKMECANHITKCLRGNLENLVNENPSYKGKGKLCKRTRIRIVSAVRCSIRRRSSEKNKTLAIKNLEHDIRNTTSHIYGDHTRCNEDFCKMQFDDNDDDNGDDDIFLQQSEMWTQGTSLQAQEQSRGSYMLSNSDLQSGMRQDLALLLNNVARKARSLLGGSPDGVVTENNAKGLIEIINLVHDKNINLTQASISKSKCSGPKFVGREILHEWVEENSNRKWYKGRVISCIQNKDRDKDAVYEVLYEDCDEPYEIDHLLEDFTNSSLKLIDL
ncbi:Hypothetical predicted protein [Mytilus galloprovincialis]|uniref:Mutator-like transposase domain-containing protein n=1 Tax=Mytilus galloprovincialis TaxID=29158 RepID=A0A8B6F0L1_MYTGA|nr:Hypothetical predicted protein [Mytilus galloprovincialis]